ncbi:hypothetical protein A5821_002364 [Enterococcus sp. 7F3_DIV0205]|uniref:Uncharacterized protein n=1 Tax=Candidatus Enterococcus palustris TaxID=1834189 RepID=A0AAQ3Y6N4_9ENTE|nr:hypothetical protein [Enterococcus sp. 7F3_DIV0205]OTN82795.1 hypothetical protein A5821_002718 [Enterococcus sp. 7F3_DIV0205]
MAKEQNVSEKEGMSTLNPTSEQEKTAEKDSYFVLGQIVVGLSIFVLIGFILLLSYRLFPMNQKVSGNWQTNANQSYQLKISGNRATLVVEKLNGMDGVRMEVNSTIFPVDSTHYRGKETFVHLLINKQKQDKQELEAIKQQRNYYKLVKETNEQLTLEYTSEAKLMAFGAENLDSYFQFEINAWRYGIMPTKIHFLTEDFVTEDLIVIK